LVICGGGDEAEDEERGDEGGFSGFDSGIKLQSQNQV
jgi:hypothetical protein